MWKLMYNLTAQRLWAHDLLPSVALAILLSSILLFGCSPATQKEAVRQAQFLAVPMPERAVVLSDELDNTLASLVGARAVIRAYWTQYSMGDQTALEIAGIRAQELVSVARSIADSGGLKKTMELGRAIARGQAIRAEVLAVLLRNRDLFKPVEWARLEDADSDLHAFYELAATVHGASGRVDAAHSIWRVAKTVVGLAL